ncbi:MAG: hypothetical protein IPI30_12420 [Saprospiraceae bacterium]|nr:hypothetical protein [Candidatus Vicinibacter affinis]
MKKRIYYFSVLKYFSILLVVIIFNSCSDSNQVDVSRKETVRDWNKLLIELERFTPGYRGPVSARMFAYVELAAYLSSIEECNFVNTSEMLSHLELYHGVEESGIEPGIAINSCFAALAEMFFPTITEEYKNRISALNIKK